VSRRLLLLLGTLAALALGAANPAAAACATEYLVSLQQVRSHLDSGGAPEDPGTLRRIAAATSSASVLQPVIGDLEATPPNLSDAKRRLDAILGALQLPPQTACGQDTAAARGALRDVYQSPVFDNLDQAPPPPSQPSVSPLAGLLRAIGLPLAILILALILAAIAGYALWRLRGVSAGADTVAGEEPAVAGSDPDAEWRQALDAAQRGDHREAIRRAFRSALLDVAGAGRLTMNAAWTTRELLAQASGDADLLAALAPAADAFDRAWYSGAAITAQDWEVARGRCQAVRSLAGRRVEVTA
jgi:hypothetical protein